MANEKPELIINDRAVQDGSGYSSLVCAVGKDLFGFAFGSADGALRFTNIDIGQGESINFANLYYKIGSSGSTSGRWKVKVSGIAEDNTAAFSVGVFGRSRTASNTVFNDAAPSGSGYKVIDVTSILQEIINRGGWSRNNAAGLILADNGSDSNVWAIPNENATTGSFLVYRVGAEPNFLPSPITVSVPTFPAPKNFGIEIAMPGVSVLDATDDQLFFSTKWYVPKVLDEQQVSITGGVLKTIYHGLGYHPQARVWVTANGYSFKLNRLFFGATDPVGGGIEGTYWTDNDNLYIFTGQNCSAYYYIFLDELQ